MHFALASLLGAAGIVISNLFRQNTLIAMVGLTLATLGILATFPLFWPMPTAMLAGTAAAAGIAWINSLGNLAGFFGALDRWLGHRSDKAKRLRPLRRRRGVGAWLIFGSGLRPTEIRCGRDELTILLVRALETRYGCRSQFFYECGSDQILIGCPRCGTTSNRM